MKCMHGKGVLPDSLRGAAETEKVGEYNGKAQ